MKRIVIKAVSASQWLYTIYIDDRAVVVGMTHTLEEAEAAARLA